MSKTEQDDIVKNLRACVSSSKGGIPVSVLCSELHFCFYFIGFFMGFLCVSCSEKEKLESDFLKCALAF
jgi:hypothetical protein